MLKLLKVFLRGLIVTLLLPFIVVIWVGYGLYCIGLFVFMFAKTTIEYFKGGSFNADLPEDLEARRMVLEKEKRDEQAKEMLSSMYENTVAQQQSNMFSQTPDFSENNRENTDFLDEMTSDEPTNEEDYNDDNGVY